MNICEKCGKYFCEGHCRPFSIYYPEYYGEEKKIIYGNSYEGVIEKIAEKINSDDPFFDDDIFETPVEITDENGLTKLFNCVASVSVNYHSKEIKKDKMNRCPVCCAYNKNDAKKCIICGEKL